jgi:hypothetical protein
MENDGAFKKILPKSLLSGKRSSSISCRDC